MPDCPFCTPDASRLILVEGEVDAISDAFPASPGPALIIPRRQVASWFEATGPLASSI